MATRSKIYIEACPLIDVVKVKFRGTKAFNNLQEEEQKIRENDVWFIQQILRAGLEKDVEIFTSAISIAECTHVGDKPVQPKVKELFRAVLLSGQAMKLIEPDLFVCEDARNLIWDHDIHLKGADAIHIASALSKDCEEFLTTDTRITDNAGIIKTITGLRIVRPSETILLPDSYRQQSAFVEA